MVVIRLFRNSIKGGFVCFRQLGVGRIFRASAGMQGGAGILMVGFLAGLGSLAVGCFRFVAFFCISTARN